jgi:hypothetical protein
LVGVDEYQARWPWLKRFDAVALADGERWSCSVQPPLPYRVSFELALHDVVELRSVAADVSGDITGTARIELVATSADSTELRFESSLEPASTWLRRISVIAMPVARYGHDAVIDRALAEFAAHLPRTPRRT